MSKAKLKTPRPKRVSKKQRINTRKRNSIKGFLLKETESLQTLQIKAEIKTDNNESRIPEFELTKDIRFNRSKIAAQMALNVFTLLSGGKKPNSNKLVLSFIQNKLLNQNDLNSFITKKKGGRKRKYRDKETGEIFNMKQPNKNICELFNHGKKPEEIRNVVFRRFRTEKGKMDKLFFVRRILRENKEFLDFPID